MFPRLAWAISLDIVAGVLVVVAICVASPFFFFFFFLIQAGLASPSNPEQVLIALEPEAASVYCRRRKMREFVAESGSDDASVGDTLALPDTQYVVIDIGGKKP